MKKNSDLNIQIKPVAMADVSALLQFELGIKPHHVYLSACDMKWA